MSGASKGILKKAWKLSEGNESRLRPSLPQQH